jgi:hypothetical protein
LISRYSTSAATLHFRAYTLRHDRQVLGFHLAARRAQDPAGRWRRPRGLVRRLPREINRPTPRSRGR